MRDSIYDITAESHFIRPLNAKATAENFHRPG